MKRRQLGFTLMELLIVLVIVGLLAALAGPALYQRIKPARQSVAQAQIQSFMTALDSYFVDAGSYPTTQQGLLALREAPEGVTNWQGPYLKRDLPNDPWGRAYQYAAPGRSGGYEIFSFGADGREGGQGEDQDISSWSSAR